MDLRLRKGSRLSRGNNTGKKSPNHCSGAFCFMDKHMNLHLFIGRHKGRILPVIRRGDLSIGPASLSGSS